MKALYNVYRLGILVMICMMALVILSPIFEINEILYPIRVDSIYVRTLQQQYDAAVRKNAAEPGKTFYYSPSQLNLLYDTLNVLAGDGAVLKGWYFNQPKDANGITILFLPDIGEGKINYIEKAKAFTELGFRVYVADMRAHGESSGNFFSLGETGREDVGLMLDSLYSKPDNRFVALIGSGAGAALAVEAMLYDTRPVALVLQNPFLSFENYLHDYAAEKWGPLNSLFYSVMKRQVEKKMGISADSLNLESFIKRVHIPTLFIASESNKTNNPALIKLFEESGASKKILKKADDEEVESDNNELLKNYYNTIASFISTSIPKKDKKTRYRRLADS